MLYKYLSKDRVDVLQSLKIRFSQPQALNDPFESLPLINLEAPTRELIKKIEKDAEELWSSLPEHEKTKENQEELKNQLALAIQDAKESTCPAKVGHTLMSALADWIGVLSLSRSFSNLLMWSHYAESHQGYVLGLDDSHPFFHQATYEGFSTSPSKVSYTSQRSKTLAGDKNYYETLLCEKPIDWAYEEEIRIFRLLNSRTSTPGKDQLNWDIHLFDIPPDAIKCIYIGANASEETKNSLIKAADNHKLEVQKFQMSLSKFCYNLEWLNI